MRIVGLLLWQLSLPLVAFAETAASAPAPHSDLLTSVGLCFGVAAILAVLASRFKQPSILAYLAAGVLIGPEIGLGWITDQQAIEVIAEVGLLLLLFIIGLEIDLKKLRRSGKPVLVIGVSQFLLCAGLGLVFFPVLGFGWGQTEALGGRLGLLYMATTAALSSTLIVVKLLYDKFELDTLPGRITLGVLVFQDIWAILLLAMQPNLLHPQVGPLVAAFVKGILLVVASLLISRYLLPPLFRSIAKLPELMLVASLAWCFFISAAAHHAGLSREMGALIAGIALSTFPYSLDVIAKVISIRDFFVTLFFVALGMKIPMPSSSLIMLAMVSSVFLIASRFVSIFPVLYWMGHGHRASLLPAINLSQMSEFSLIIGSLGLTFGHVDHHLVSLLIVIFAITSTASTYMIQYSHSLYQRLSHGLRRLHVHDLDAQEEGGGRGDAEDEGKRIVFLGFFREASSVLHEFELRSDAGDPSPLLDEMLIIDFNPVVHAELRRRGFHCLYGDVAHMETLHQAQIHRAELVISTIPDAILKGTTNARLLEQVRRLSPLAKVIVTADSVRWALDLYQQGADYVFLPRLHSASLVAKVIELGLQEGFEKLRADEVVNLQMRNEVLP
jgi:Kef-type K+ transport system membrane component KefB